MTVRTSFFGPPLTGGCAARRTSRRSGGARRRSRAISPAITRIASGGNSTDAPAASERGALGVDGQRAGGLGVEAAARAHQQLADGDEAERRAGRARRPRRRRSGWPWSASDAAPCSAPRTIASTAKITHVRRPLRRLRPGAADGEGREREHAPARSRAPAPARGRRSRCRRSRCRGWRRRARRRGARAGTGGSRSPPRCPRPAADRRGRVHSASVSRRGGMTLDETPRGSTGGGEARRVSAPRSTTRDLERYAGLFARRTQGMKSSAMRDLMAVTAQPEVISLAGGLPDTSTFPAEDFAALMAHVAVDSAAGGAPVRADRGPGRAQGVHRPGDGGRGHGGRARRPARHHRRPAGHRPRLQDAARPGRRRDRRGADLSRRGAGLRLLPGRRRPDRDGRRRHADRPHGGGARPPRRRGPRAEVHLHGARRSRTRPA